MSGSSDSRMIKETIRVVVCGDDGVGKTSLIISLVKGAFEPYLQPVLPQITIPRDFSSSRYSPKNTKLIDTDNNDPVGMQRELRNADVIWLVYSDKDSYERISLYWMITFRSLGLNIPVILCKNKCDEYTTSSKPEDFMNTKVEDEEFIPILMAFKEVDTCIKTSAKTHFAVNQAFYLCQRSILYPISPLFDSRVGELKPLAVSALKRIFILCDEDQDGFLSDDEIISLQKKCFGKSIDLNELNFIKQTLMDLSSSEEYPSDILFVPTKGLTKQGFIALNKIYTERGRHETTWGILRNFHYTDSLSIDDEVLYPKVYVPEQASVELSPKGYRFLVDIFIKFDSDNDGALNDGELSNLFRSTPGLPNLWRETNFPASTVVNGKGFITLQGWLAQWAMTTYLDYKATTAYLVYLGFQENAKVAVQVTKSRKMRRRQGRFYRSYVSDRKVFNCFIVGKRNSGKSSLLESFLGRLFSESYSPTIRPRLAVNNVEVSGDKQFYLILQELGEQETAIIQNRQKLSECDALCLVYDSSDPESFSYLVELYENNSAMKDIPIVFVALKADLDKQQQRCQYQPDEFTESLFLDHPLHVSSTWSSSLSQLFKKIIEASLVPGKYTPGFPPETKPTEIDYSSAVIVGSSIGFLALLSFTVAKLLRPLQQPK